MAFGLEFWGVRGSIACPSPKHVRYGGNTSCLEVQAGDHTLILDAGTGIRSLGHKFLKADIKRARLFLTHTHWDHINGFPFFIPAFQKDRTFEILAGHLTGHGGIQEVLAGQMMQPTFPVPLETMKAVLKFEDFNVGDIFNLEGGVRVRTAPLNHPNGRLATASSTPARPCATLPITNTSGVNPTRTGWGPSKAAIPSCTARTTTAKGS